MVFALCGGDARQAELARLLLEDGHEVRSWALERAELPGGAKVNPDDVDEKAFVRVEAIILSMTPAERAAVLEAIRVRGEHFYKHYVKDFETHSMDNHVWQHTFRNFLFTSVATLGDLPEAEKWFRYCYEIWCARFPILGGDDGGWHDGSSYMQANLVTFVYVPFVLSRLTGTDFFDLFGCKRLGFPN